MTCPLIRRSARPRQRGGAVFAFTRLVHLVGALARPLPAGAVRCPVAFSLSATFAYERPARRCSMIAAIVSCSGPGAIASRLAVHVDHWAASPHAGGARCFRAGSLYDAITVSGSGPRGRLPSTAFRILGFGGRGDRIGRFRKMVSY